MFWICSGDASYRTDIININAILIPIRKMGQNGGGGGSNGWAKKNASKMYIHEVCACFAFAWQNNIFSTHVHSGHTHTIRRCLCCTFYRSHMANTVQAWNYLPNSLCNVFIRSIWYENTSQIPLSKWFQMPESAGGNITNTSINGNTQPTSKNSN